MLNLTLSLLSFFAKNRCKMKGTVGHFMLFFIFTVIFDDGTSQSENYSVSSSPSR